MTNSDARHGDALLEKALDVSCLLEQHRAAHSQFTTVDPELRVTKLALQVGAGLRRDVRQDEGRIPQAEERLVDAERIARTRVVGHDDALDCGRCCTAPEQLRRDRIDRLGRDTIIDI